MVGFQCFVVSILGWVISRHLNIEWRRQPGTQRVSIRWNKKRNTWPLCKGLPQAVLFGGQEASGRVEFEGRCERGPLVLTG